MATTAAGRSLRTRRRPAITGLHRGPAPPAGARAVGRGAGSAPSAHHLPPGPPKKNDLFQGAPKFWSSTVYWDGQFWEGVSVAWTAPPLVG